MDRKSIFATLLAAMVLAGCGSNSERLTNDEINEYGGMAYSDIVSFIIQGYQCHWENMSPEEMGLSMVYQYCSPSGAFVEKDINGDGINELLLGDCFENGTVNIYDIFTINPRNASLVHLARGGERDRFSILADGAVVEEGSSSASDSFTRAFRLKNCILLALKKEPSCKEAMDLEMDYFLNYIKDESESNHPVGGYTDQREPTEDEVAMFRKVTGDGTMALTPLSVATQVVAGTNYRFYCRFEDKDAELGYGHCYVYIFKPLPNRGEPSLSEIEKL